MAEVFWPVFTRGRWLLTNTAYWTALATMRVYDRKMLQLVATSLLAAVLAWPALAGDEDGRHRMLPTADRFLKLDTRSGAVSECRPAPDGYQCRLVPHDQLALQAEIDRLAGENSALKERHEMG